MMKTRRRSKAAKTAAVDEPQPDSATRESTPAPPSAIEPVLSVMIPADVKVDVLSALLPGVSLMSPSPEDIQAMYKLIIAQTSEVDASQRELDGAHAALERTGIELEQALQDKESAVQELQETLTNVQKELSQVKQEKEELATSQNALQAQLVALTNNQTLSSTEVETLKHRVDDAEREKRDLVVVVSRLREDITQRDEEIMTLRNNLRQARQDHQALESQLRELRSSETATKFKVDSLTQQLKLAKAEAERASAELAAKTEEFAKYRRAKHAELAQLQASHDALAQTHAATESTLKTLQSQHSSQTHQFMQALARIQDLTGQLAEQEATFSSEAAGLKRLVEMMEARETQAKAIVDTIEKEWADVGERAERREAVLKEEIEEQKHRAEEAEKRIDELQAVLDRIDRGEFPLPNFASGSMPVTPARGFSTPGRNGTPSDLMTQGMMGLSPTVALASRSQRGGKTFSEIYADYVRLQEEYAKKSAEYDHMDRTLSAVLAQIEERAPILAQQRAEYERLQSEATQLASQLAQALSERDAHASAAEDNSVKLSQSTKENGILQKQLADLGRQIRVLLKELGRQQDPTLPPDDEIDFDESTEELTADIFITNNLVLYRSIPQLQEQNQRLLKMVRELGGKLESEEKDYKEQLDREQSEAIREAHEAMKLLQEQLESHKKSSEVKIQAYMKERDSLKSLLARERAAGGRTVVDINGHDETFAPQSDLAKELQEVQNQYEVYRTEIGVDTVRLREEVIAAQREANQLHAALAKANAKIEFLNDRHRMAQDQNMMQNRELENLTKRNQQLYDQYTRIDIECNRVSEELLAGNGLVEQLRNECANLRAEKKIWEDIQSRLVEDNKALTIERSRLADLMTNVQRMHGDLERSGENDRRRLESQIKLLENQTQELRTQLNNERDSIRHATLQKDIEIKELQAKVEKAAHDFAKTRESLVGAETSKKHLEERVEDLTKQLQGNEEKLAVYERRASGASGIGHHANQDLSREQQLEAEVAELRSALKVAEVDLATARSHVQQFQEIASANEAALATLNATHDEYKASTEAELTTREAEYNALQEKFEGAQQELAQFNQKYAQLQETFETERVAWANDKKTLEDTIVDMSTSERSSENDRTSRETELRQQEERAKAAEERYSHEVLAHAESIKTVDALREQLSKAQTAARDNLAAALTASAKLTSSETSWRQQKDALDKEITDLNTRCKDLASQNNILHQHLESVSSQAARIRQAADSSSAVAAEGDALEDADTKLSELRSVVAYLRKEKEIVDLQLELSKQENTRLKSQIEHLSQALEETRKTLSEERERAVENATSEAQHQELLERINQLTILRESNATLRADCESHARRARELDTKLKQLSGELEPTREQLRVAQAELQAKEHQVKRLEEENLKWKERNSQLLTKYDRIDPAEVQSLKDEIELLKVSKASMEREIDQREEQLKSQAAKIASLEEHAHKMKEIGQKNNSQYRARFATWTAQQTEMTATITDLKTQLETVTEERDRLKQANPEAGAATVSDVDKEALSQQLETLRAEKESSAQQLEAEKAAHAEHSAKLTELEELVASLQKERDDLKAEKSNWIKSDGTAAPQPESQQQWEAEKKGLMKARDDAVAQAKAALEQAQKAAEDVKSIKFANEKFQTRLQELSQARAADAQKSAAREEAAVAAAVEKLRKELQDTAPATSPSTDELINKHKKELQELETRLAKKHEEELQAAVDAAVAAAKRDSAPATSSSGGDQAAAIEAAIAAHEAKAKEQREQDLAAAVDRGRMEQAAKIKLKDQQLMKVQSRLKELETQLLELENKGIIPRRNAAGNAPNKTAPAASTAPTATAPAKPAAETAPAAVASTSGTTAVGQANLPRKPSAIQPARGLARGVTRGVGRGALSIRGAAPGGRGGAPAASTSANAAGGASNGVSIMGAAGKRARDETGEAATDDSLAKRLKPADGTSKPVPIRRDRVPPPP
ncbi:hypothetical protein CERSUDRAFT_112402 [Gelatoporia subvermispora B]|uniref:Uncharacterized protein n=1 Tax=Ceriporiopsis subvermispora (strain B) TaxID=914234 RepID=M2PTY9_CERS8|nr:hypothetical protein CERSUDRAFT_112402 [Gelatoporia subvermispora B]